MNCADTSTFKLCLLILYACLEFWLGRTEKVKAGSVPEAIFNGLVHVGLSVVVLVLITITFIFNRSKK